MIKLCCAQLTASLFGARRWMFGFVVLLVLLLAELPAQAANYKFADNQKHLPAGCSGSNGTYTCGTLTLAAGDTVTVGSPKPATINVTGAFSADTGVLINSAGAVADLTLNVTGALTLGSSATLNANVTSLAAVTIGDGSLVGGYIAASTTTGVVTIGANSKVGSYISTDAGAVNIGDGSSVGGDVTTAAGVVTLTKSINVVGSISTVAGGISIGDGSTICNDVISTGAGVVVLTTNIKIGGDVSTTSGAVTIGAGSTVGGNIIITGGGVVTLNSVLVGGNISTTAGAITLTTSHVGGSVTATGAGVITLTASTINDQTLFLAAVCVNSNKLPTSIAEYRFDELTWSGATGEVKNMVFGGTAGTSQKGAVTNTGKVCRAGVFNGTSQFVSVSNLSNHLSGTASLSFWIKTSQVGNDTMWQAPGVTGIEDSGGSDDIFWGWIDGSGRIGVMKGDTAGAKSKIAINNNIWHHIVLTRNASTGNTKVFVDGSLQRQATSATGVVTKEFSSIGRIESTLGANDAKYLHGSLDEFKVFSEVLSKAQVSDIFNNENAGKNWDGTARICAGSSVDAGVFECIESGQNNPWVSTARKPLFTKMASTAFTFDIAAVKTDGTLESNYVAAGSTAKDVTLELVDGSGTTACASRVAISPAVSQTISFADTDQGRKTAPLMTVAKAYPDLRCRVTDANQTPSLVACSSDNFAVRPSALTLVTSATAGAPFATAAPVIKAGGNFSLSATTNPNSSYTGALTLDTGKLTAQITSQDSTQVSGGVVGTLTSASLKANAGAINATYSEVGYLYLAPGAYRDDAFTAVDSATGDCITSGVSDSYLADTLIGGQYGCSIGNKTAVSFGRFIPDHFAVTLPVFTPGCGTFTYMGQPFSLSATVEAQSVGSSKTKNFNGVFANATVTSEIENANNGIALDLTRLIGLGTPAWSNGAYLFVADHFSRGAAPDGAFDDMDIGLRVDAETTLAATLRPYLRPRDMAAANTSCTTDSTGTSDGTCTAVRIASGSRFRFGQLRLQNAYGSEQLPLSVPLQARFWTGNFFVNSVDDSCTAVSVPVARTLTGSAKPDGLPNLYFYPVVTGKNELLSAAAVPTLQTMAGVATGSLISGQARLQFAAPRTRGWLDLILGVPDYMDFNWGNCNGQTGAAGLLDDWPCSRVTFGIFGRRSPIIYRRENY